MGLWVYEIDPCHGRCGVTGGGRLLLVVDCGAPGHLAVLAGRQRIVMTVWGNNAHVAAESIWATTCSPALPSVLRRKGVPACISGGRSHTASETPGVQTRGQP